MVQLMDGSMTHKRTLNDQKRAVKNIQTKQENAICVDFTSLSQKKELCEIEKVEWQKERGSKRRKQKCRVIMKNEVIMDFLHFLVCCDSIESGGTF